MDMDAFFKLHSGLPREGPGSDEATREAIRRLRVGPASSRSIQRVLDIGCGPGRQTLVLARELQTPIIAIDFHEPFLEQLRRSARAAGLDHLITPLRAGMESLDLPPGSVDLIWTEGAIYIIGFATGLSLWRLLLREGGIVVASEMTWLTENPPAEVRDFWQQGCPHMTTIEGNIANAAAVGFEAFDHFVLPREAWWDEYLTPLDHRIAELRKTATEPDLLAVLDEQERETDIVRRYGEHFSYVFYLLRKIEMPDQKGCMHEHS
jgi:serine/threonine-protein kinase HipA